MIVLGDAGRRLGAGMKRGTLVLPGLGEPARGASCSPRLPGPESSQAPFLTIYYRQLAEWGFPVSRAVSSALLERYNGDMVVGGQGEVLVGQHVA